jgi:hypothetical protein
VLLDRHADAVRDRVPIAATVSDAPRSRPRSRPCTARTEARRAAAAKAVAGPPRSSAHADLVGAPDPFGALC